MALVACACCRVTTFSAALFALVRPSSFGVGRCHRYIHFILCTRKGVSNCIQRKAQLSERMVRVQAGKWACSKGSYIRRPQLLTSRILHLAFHIVRVRAWYLQRWTTTSPTKAAHRKSQLMRASSTVAAILYRRLLLVLHSPMCSVRASAAYVHSRECPTIRHPTCGHRHLSAGSLSLEVHMRLKPRNHRNAAPWRRCTPLAATVRCITQGAMAAAIGRLLLTACCAHHATPRYSRSRESRLQTVQ